MGGREGGGGVGGRGAVKGWEGGKCSGEVGGGRVRCSEGVGGREVQWGVGGWEGERCSGEVGGGRERGAVKGWEDGRE